MFKFIDQKRIDNVSNMPKQGLFEKYQSLFSNALGEFEESIAKDIIPQQCITL
jgi:hypothetical protein